MSNHEQKQYKLGAFFGTPGNWWIEILKGEVRVLCLPCFESNREEALAILRAKGKEYTRRLNEARFTVSQQVILENGEKS